MTPAEFKTLRERLGLSGETLGTLLPRSVIDRTVRRWESGAITPIPNDACEFLRALDERAEQQVRQTQAFVAAARAEQGQAAEGITLLRYADLNELRAVDVDTAHLGLGFHAALIGRVREALEREGVPVRIVFFDAAAYAAWRRAERLPDLSSTRAAWAAQVSGCTLQ